MGDLVLPVDDSVDVEEALRHSIRLAKSYGARIVLMYVTHQRFIPQGYADYARAEKVRDYDSMYFSSMGESATADLRRRVEEEGVECATSTCVGDLADAIRACQRSERVLMLVLTLRGRPLLRRLGLGGLGLGGLTALRVPVVLVPERTRTRRREGGQAAGKSD